MVESKKSVSAHQPHRMLGITYKSAWFMGHRMRPNGRCSPLGGEGKIVEADEAYYGKIEDRKPSRQRRGLALIQMRLKLASRGNSLRLRECSQT
jgi:hypothetical protein